MERDKMTGYDIIGDIHGHADALEALLRKLDYRLENGAWRHPGRQAIFVGDFVDLGPRQIDTVITVRRMVDAGSALAIMGNHEFNAIAWFLPDPAVPGDFLRPHFSAAWGAKNRRQHAAFLAEVEANPKLHEELIDWFLTLPLWLDLPELRVVHACWHPEIIRAGQAMLLPGAKLDREMMLTAAPESEREPLLQPIDLNGIIEICLKGLEIPLPPGHSFLDKYAIERHRVRARWWDPDAKTFRQTALLDPAARDRLPDLPIPADALVAAEDAKPTFIGHYWLTGQPAPLSDSVVCVDYSAGKGGPLCAYRWSGDPNLAPANFVAVSQ